MALLVSSAAAVTYAQSQPEWEIVRANAAGAFAPDHKDYIPKEFGRLARQSRYGKAPGSASAIRGSGSRLQMERSANGVFKVVIVFPRR